MKTPEQIAREASATLKDFPDVPSEHDLRQAMITAIKTDREQRRITFDTLDHMLNAWENYDGDVSGFMDAWLGHFNEGADVPDWAKAP